MSVTCIPPYTPLLYNKTGVCRGIPIFFFIFLPKHRLWVLVRTASAQSIFFSKNKKNILTNLLKIFNFYNLRKICITLYTVDATEYVTAQIDATFHEGREKRRTVS